MIGLKVCFQVFFIYVELKQMLLLFSITNCALDGQDESLEEISFCFIIVVSFLTLVSGVQAPDGHISKNLPNYMPPIV